MRQLNISAQPTDRKSIVLDKFLQEISKYPLLSVEEEAELTRRIKENDMQALETLINSNLRFVVSVSKQYQRQGLPLVDLINEGNIGLIKAAVRFDETKGFKFISYAVWWIRQSIITAIEERGRLVRLPSNKIHTQKRIQRISNELEQKLQRKPTSYEIAEKLNLDLKLVKKMLNSINKPLSMDAPISSSNNYQEYNLYDIIFSQNNSPDQKLTQISAKKEINRIVASMKKTEKEIIELHFGLNGNRAHTLEEIGEKFNLSKERVRQIKVMSLEKLKEKMNYRPKSLYFN